MLCCERVFIGSSCVDKWEEELLGFNFCMDERKYIYICGWSMNSTLGSQQRKRFCMHSCTIWHTIFEPRTNSWVTAEDLALFTRQAFYQVDFAKWISRPPCLAPSPAMVLSMWPHKNIFHIQVQLFTLFFSTPPIKLNLG